jgi:hypothetical protein
VATAQLLGGRKDVALRALPAILADRFDALRRPGPCDLLHEAIIPSVHDLLAEISGLRLDPGQDTLLSRIFSETLGPARRRRLNAEVAACQERLRDAFPEDTPVRAGARLAVSILGRDALVGTLGLSLHAHLLALEKSRSPPGPSRPCPPHTGVPHVQREALADAVLGENAIHAGEIVKVALDSFEGCRTPGVSGSSARASTSAWGGPLALAVQEQLSALLGTMTTRVAVRDFRLRKDDISPSPRSSRSRCCP